MTVRIDESLQGIDWAQAKADLAADDFDNGRSPGRCGRRLSDPSMSPSPGTATA